MAPRVSQHPVATGQTQTVSTTARSFTVEGTFAPKEVWGVFSPLRSLHVAGEQFKALLRTGESLAGRFEFRESAVQDTLVLAAETKRMIFNVVDMTLGRGNELTSMKLVEPSAKTPPFSLFLKR